VLKMIFIPDILLVFLSYSQTKLPSDVVQGQRPTTRLPSALGVPGERDAVVYIKILNRTDPILRGGKVWCGLLQCKKCEGSGHSSIGEECADTGFIFSSKTAKDSLKC